MKSRQLISSLLISAMLFSATAPALADANVSLPPIPTPELVAGEKVQGAVISPLKMGQKAPFTGILISPAAIAQIIVNFNNAAAQTQIEVTKAVETQKATDQLTISDLQSEAQYQKTVNDAQVKAYSDQLALVTKKLADTENSAPSRTTWFAVGGVSGIVFTLLTVYAVSRVTK